MSREVTKLSWPDFLKQYDKEVHDALATVRKHEDVTGVVTLQCEMMGSSRFGMLTAMIYGPGCTFKTVDDMLKLPGGVYPTGLPSSASFPINFTEDMPA
jgi:hypothetical protein